MDSALKRFTDTGKWNDPWFRALSPTAKLLWSWLVDHCDNAGVIDPDTALAEFQIGNAVEEKHFTELGDRLQRLPNGKLWIPKFIRFQFGELNPESRVHTSVIKLLDFHNIQYPINSLSIGYVKGSDTPKDKDKDKDKDRDKEKKKDFYGQIETRLCRLFNRNGSTVTSYLEQSAIAEICRRKDCIDELGELEEYHKKEKEYFPRSLSTLVNEWEKYLDHARNWKPKTGKFDKPEPTAKQKAAMWGIK